jgi:RHS repeat-associated protein
VSDTTGTTDFIYHPDGNRLITHHADGTATLYLPEGVEIHADTTGGTTCTRYYAGTAVRTTGGLSWLAADHHHTATHTINATTLNVTTRRTDPYGNPRGTTTGGTWPDDKTFLGAPQDPTGLVHLGAREYDPGTGRFISLDPVMDLTDPQQIHGYTYANNNPITWTDPTGLFFVEDTAGTGRRAFASKGSGGTTKITISGGVPPASCSDATREYCHKPGANRIGGYSMGVQWGVSELVGIPCILWNDCPFGGPGRPMHVEYFRDGDPFTEGIRRHEHILKALAHIALMLSMGVNGGTYDLHYGDPIKFSREDRKQIFWNNLDSVLTFGLAGMPIEQAYLGSYDLEWEVIGHNAGDVVVELHLTNASTLRSAAIDPDKLNTDVYGNDSAGAGLDAVRGEFWMQQSVRWRETFPGGNVPRGRPAWRPVWPGPSTVIRPIVDFLRGIY